MSSFKKHCWVLLIPLLAIIYWKKGKQPAVNGNINGIHFINTDSIPVQTTADFKTVVMR